MTYSREKNTEYQRKWRAKNIEKYRVYQKEYHQRYRERKRNLSNSKNQEIED